MPGKLLIGTSGFAYPAWRGKFYPKNLVTAEFLAYYAQHFATVEINNTFYRMPHADTVAQWKSQVPATFSFVLKAPQRITHRARLRDCADPLGYFYKVAQTLGKQLGRPSFSCPPTSNKTSPACRTFLPSSHHASRLPLSFAILRGSTTPCMPY